MGKAALSELVQADKNLLTGVLISDGFTHHKPIWREIPNFNSSDFLSVNMKAALVSQAAIKDA